ncbi:MAG: NUDIX hydrolase, partial [Xanthomonadales bacterium]|nr:NUDIX hydrolase [Xanthomonadales bacterium]
KTFIRITFAGKGLYHDQEYQLDSCIEQTVWLTHEEIRNKGNLLRSPMVLRSIEDYLSGTCYPLALLADID